MNNSVGIIDDNATGAINMMLQSSHIFYLKANIDFLKGMYVMWRNKKNVLELTKDENIPEHEKKEKIIKIEFFKNAVLKNEFTDTTIFCMRKDQDSPMVITDGIHRSIAIQRAILQNINVKNKITLRILLFEGKFISTLDDYK